MMLTSPNTNYYPFSSIVYFFFLFNSTVCLVWFPFFTENAVAPYDCSRGMITLINLLHLQFLSTNDCSGQHSKSASNK